MADDARRLARQLVSRQKRIRVENPDCELWQVVQPNNNGTLRLTRPHWPFGSYIDNIQIRGGGKASSFRPGQGAYVEFENGDRNSPYVVAFGGWIPAKQPIIPGTGQWAQAEGGTGLNCRKVDGGTVIDWTAAAWVRTIEGSLPIGVTSNPSYTGRGHVYWTDADGIGWMAWGHWVERSSGIWLAVGVGRQIYSGDFATVYYLRKYDIANNGGALALGTGYGGGTDHGSLSLHYTAASNTLTAFGPLTHPDGRFDVFRIRLESSINTTFTRSVLAKPAIHASVGADSLLLAHWSPTGSEIYARNVDLYKVNSAGSYSLAKRIPLSSLVGGNDYFGCHPDNGRARGRFPYDAGQDAYYVWAASRTSATKLLGSQRSYNVSPDLQDCELVPGGSGQSCCAAVVEPEPLVYEQTEYTYYSSTQARLSRINAATGAVDAIVDVVVNVDSTVTNDESLAFFEANVSLPSVGFGVVANDMGWAYEGEVSTHNVFNHLNMTIPEPILLHPLQARNEETDAAAFMWAPPHVTGINMGPGGTCSPAGKKLIIYSEPWPELYGSQSFVSSDTYVDEEADESKISQNTAACCQAALWEPYQECRAANPYDQFTQNEDWTAWDNSCTSEYVAAYVACAELAFDGGTVYADVWRQLRRRVIYRTFLKVNDGADAGRLGPEDISHKYTGLQDLTEFASRNYEAREILDQVWDGHFCDQFVGGSLLHFEMILLLRDGRTQVSTLEISGARPILEVRDPTDATLIATIKCTPDAATNHHVRTPVMRHGVMPGDFWWCDVITCWTTSGGNDHHMRVTQVRWTETAADYTVTETDFEWGDGSIEDLPTDAEIEGMAYVNDNVLMQRQRNGKDLWRFP